VRRFVAQEAELGQHHTEDCSENQLLAGITQIHDPDYDRYDCQQGRDDHDPTSGGPQPPAQQLDGGELAAGCGWPVRTLTGCWVRALPVVVAAAKCAVCCLSSVGPRICWRIGGTGDIPIEALFPEGGGCLELASSGWSRVLGMDAIGGPPYCDVADEGGARVASRWRPGTLGVTLADVVLNLVGEVGNQLGSLCQVVAPDGMVMQRWWNAW
jgi:hypothetical protein